MAEASPFQALLKEVRRESFCQGNFWLAHRDTGLRCVGYIRHRRRGGKATQLMGPGRWYSCWRVSSLQEPRIETCADVSVEVCCE